MPLERKGRRSLTAKLSFPRTMRLSGKLAFANVYEHGQAATRGPLKLLAAANNLPHARLGLSVSRRVGAAPRRNRIKRLVRESFRLLPRARSLGYDLVIVVRPHEPMALATYQGLLDALITKATAPRQVRPPRKED
jgi:ribonuclease P protein component